MGIHKFDGDLNVTGNILKDGTPIGSGLTLYRHTLDFSYAENLIVAITPRSTPYETPNNIAKEAFKILVGIDGQYVGVDLAATEAETATGVEWHSYYLNLGSIVDEPVGDGSLFSDTVSPF